MAWLFLYISFKHPLINIYLFIDEFLSCVIYVYLVVRLLGYRNQLGAASHNFVRNLFIEM
jgi:hypothetical protein